MSDIFELGSRTAILPDDPYIASYPHLLEFFRAKDSYSSGDVVCGAHMVYGWMPTVLELYPDVEQCDLDTAADMLTRAKAGALLGGTEIEMLAGLVNNSMVGASKLLHFVAPHTFAIWDSKVFSFIHEKRPHHYRVNNVQIYLDYLARLREQIQRAGFAAFHAAMNRRIGYPVSALRSLELVMFLNSPASRA